MIFKTTDKGGLSIFGKDISEWSNDINITLNKIDEAGNKISTKISEVKTKIAEKNNKRELNKQWSYDKLIPKEEASPLNETNYNLAESYKQEYDLRQKQIAQEQEYQLLLENETTSTDAAIKLSQRRISQYDNEVSAFDNLNNSYLKKQEEQALIQKTAQEKASQNYISNLYDNQEKKNQDYISAIQTEINTSQKVQKQLENISSDSLETLGYKPKSYLKEIRAEQAEVQKQLKNIETASVKSLIPKKIEVPKQTSSLEDLRKEQSDFWNQVTAIETSSVDTIKNSTVELSREFVQEADGQIQLKVATEQYTNSLQEQNIANQNKLNLIQEENGQMALNLTGIDQQTEKTKAQTSAINALIEAKNKALLTNVSEKFNSMGVDVGEMVTVEQLKELKNSSDAATSSLAKMTLEEIGLGEGAKKASIGLKALRMAGNMIVSFAITELLSLTVKWLNELAHAEEKAKEKLEEARNELKQASSDVETANTKLDNINESISKINEKGTLSLTDQEDLDRLKKEKEELERILENYKQKEKYAKKDEEDAAVKILSDSKYTSKNDMYSYETDQDGNMKQTNNGLVSYNSIIDYFNALKQQAEEQQKYLDWMNENHPEWSGTIIDKVKNSLAATKEEMASILSNINDTSNSLYGVTDKGNDLKNTISDMNLQYETFRYQIGETSFDSLTASAKKLAAALRLDNNEEKDNILNYLNSLSEDDFSKLVTSSVTFDENTTVDSLKDALAEAQKVAEDNPVTTPLDLTSLLTESDDKGTSTATLADLQSEADLLSTIQRELSDNGKISVSSMQSIIKQYPEAKDALGQYMLGIISQEELFDQLQGVYEDDKNAYIYSLVEKSKYDGTFYSNLVNTNNDFFAGLSEAYGEDFSNYKNLAQAKQKIDDQLIKYLSGMWGKFYQTTIDTATGLMSLTSKATSMDDDMDLGLYLYQNGADEETNAIAEMQKMVDDYNALQNISFESAFNGIDLSWQGFSGDDSSSSNDSSSSQTKQDVDWIERLINKISTAYSHLKNVVSDTTTTWLNRNNALSDSMSTLVDEINAQSDAYEYYMNAFNSYGLDDYYKNQIADGSISIDVIYDDDLKDAISDCQDFYDKAQDAKTAVQELGIELKGLAKNRFDNVASEFEEKINKIVAVRDLYSKEDELMNEKGWFSSTLLNSAMIDQENKNLQKLEAERDALVNALNSAVNSGSIMPESEDWYSMQSAIDEVSSSILDAKKALVEYDNTIRQINWDAFDRTRDDVENLITETDFLTELLKDVGITDDNGNMTKEGQAAQALLAQKYQLYLNQAKAYKDEIAKIDADLANDPYDKELLDRKQDLIDKEQEAIKSAMSEKDAIKDLTNDAYSDFIDKLGDAIDKYKELMSTMKDAYDYEKSIREKTEALNVLEKQYSAYQGDNSEEGKKNIQQLKDQINSAKDDLKDTEYEKLISDTEKILDQLKDNTQEWLNQRLDQLDNLIQDIIDQSNDNASDIAETITSTAENYGYKLSESMASIWSTNTGNITKVLDNFSTSFIDSNSKIKDVCDNINSAVQGLLANSNAEAQRVADEIARQQAEQNASSDGGYSGGNDYSDDDWSGNWDTGSDDNDSSGSDGVDWIYSKDYFDKNSLNIDTSIVDRLKLHDYDSSFAARSQYYDQMGGEGQYYATYDQNVWMLDWMKSHGYRKGTKSAISGLHIYGEDDPGSEVLVTKYGVLRQFDSGDTVFNKDQVEKLWNLSKGITTPNMYMDNLGAKLPDISNMSNNLSNKVDVQFGDVTLSLPNVRNYEDFMKEAQKDPKFEKMIQNMTLGQTLGRNSLNKLTFR